MSGVSVLYVDDHPEFGPDAVKVIRNSPAHFTVTYAETFDKAKELIEHNVYDAVVVDNNLDGNRDGAKLLDLARKHIPDALLILHSAMPLPAGTEIPDGARLMLKSDVLKELEKWARKRLRVCRVSGAECVVNESPDAEDVERLLHKLLEPNMDLARRTMTYRRIETQCERAEIAFGSRFRLAFLEAQCMLGRGPRVLAGLEAALGEATNADIREALDRLERLRDVRVQELADRLREKLGATSSLPVILHVSDLHFGKKGTEDMHRFTGLHQTLAYHVERELAAIRTTHGAAPVIVVISGDIGYCAMPDEYVAARAFLDKVCAAGVPVENIVMVPGNHDVSWHLARHLPKMKLLEYVKFVKRFYGERCRSMFPDLHDYEEIEAGRLFSVLHRPELGLCIVGINSCTYADEQHDYGLIGMEQLDMIEARLRDVGNVLKIAVFHHHLIPVETDLITKGGQVAVDSSLVRDASLVEARLNRMGFDFVMHGHKHTPSLRQTSVFRRDGTRSMYIVGCGSTGVAPSELPTNLTNHLSVLRPLSRRRIPGAALATLTWRLYEPNQGWTNDHEWVLFG